MIRNICLKTVLSIAAIAAVCAPAHAQERSPALERGLPAANDLQPFAEAVRADTQWLTSFKTRFVGTPEHAQMIEELRERLEAVPNVRIWEHEYEVVVPDNFEAELTVAEGSAAGSHTVFPIWTPSGRMNTTDPEGFAADVIYVGEADFNEFPARGLRGQIAALELTAHESWKNAGSFGAKAILLLGSGKETHEDVRSNFMMSPTLIPRFYIPEGPLAEAIRNGDVDAARLLSQGSFKRATATNFYVLVEGAYPEPLRAFIYPAAIDSMALSPGYAPGADSAVDAAFMLNLLRRFAENPQERPVLFTFVDAFSLNMRGMREMLGAFAATPDLMETYVEADLEYLERLEELTQMLDELEETGEPIYWVYQQKYGALHQYIKDEASLEVVELDEQIQPLRLQEIRTEGEERERIERKVAELSEIRATYNSTRTQMARAPDTGLWDRIRGWMNMAQTGDEPAVIHPDYVDVAEELWARAARRIRKALAETEARIGNRDARLEMRAELREALGLPAPVDERDVPVQFVFGLDISDEGVAVGPNTYASYYDVWDIENTEAFGTWVTDLYPDEEDLDEKLPEYYAAMSLAPQRTFVSRDSFAVGQHPIPTDPVTSFGLPSISWMTLAAYRDDLMTARDRFELLDWGRLNPQIGVSLDVASLLAQDVDFQPVAAVDPRWMRARGTIVTQGPGEPLARVPQEDYLVVLQPGGASNGSFYSPPSRKAMGTVVRTEYGFSGARGEFYFNYIPSARMEKTGMTQYYVQAYKFAPDGSIVRALDFMNEGRGAHYAVRAEQQNPTPVRGVTFLANAMNAFHMYDPRFLIEMTGVSILDAERSSAPKRMSYSLSEGVVSTVTEPTVDWQLILRNGVRANRMLLLNTAEKEIMRRRSLRNAMEGFSLEEGLPMHPAYVAARDVYRLDWERLRTYRRAGITSEPIEEIQENTELLLAEAEEAYEADDGGRFFYAASGALANEIRAYEAVRALGNDVVRAAVLLLLFLIPFSFAMERLLFASSHVYRQILVTLAIFLVMTAILWSFHPAFRISSQPLVIIMAFAIIFMSIFVIALIMMKFKGQIDEMKSQMAEASGAKTSQLGLISTAIKLGIANMRKRKLRTALTGITVVLITFALLAFTSTTSYSGEKTFELDTETTVPYTGLLVRQPGGRELVGRAVEFIENALKHYSPDEEEVVGTFDDYLLSTRYWWQSSIQPHWRLHVRAEETGREMPVKSALGLAPMENQFSTVDEVLPNWERFAELAAQFPETRTGGAYLAENTAEELGLDIGDTMVVAGSSLELVGTYEPLRLSSEVVDLDGQSILPVDFHEMGQEQKQEFLSAGNIDLLAQEMQTGEGLEVAQDLPFVNPNQLVIVPGAMLKNMRDATMRTINIKTDSHETAQALSSHLVKRFAFPIYFGSPDQGVRALATTPLLPQAPRSLLILVVLAGLIIFNTMMSSIAERKREIYIYTSLGLAPFHIGVLFLTEAITYGLMGSVFGYIIGQGFGTFLSHFELLGGLTLNYSGTQTIATMGMVVFVVVVSSLIPAYLAGRLAVPSNEMMWRVPDPKDGAIYDSLPFTVTDRTANGTMAFLRDYFEAHREGSIGSFTTDNVELFDSGVRSEEGETLLGVRGTVWLAPYDLSVRQDFVIKPTRTDEKDVLGVDIELHHGSGQIPNWIKLNKTFLGDLRRQLLGWRDLKVERILRYITNAREVAAALPGMAPTTRQAYQAK